MELEHLPGHGSSRKFSVPTIVPVTFEINCRVSGSIHFLSAFVNDKSMHFYAGQGKYVTGDTFL